MKSRVGDSENKDYAVTHIIVVVRISGTQSRTITRPVQEDLTRNWIDQESRREQRKKMRQIEKVPSGLQVW